MQTLTLTIPKPHQGQQTIIDQAKRFNVVDCGRRFGKTQLGINRLIDPEVMSYPLGWFSPSYKMLLEAWRDLSTMLEPITVRRSDQEKRIELITGGLIEAWSLDNPDVARGRKYKRVVIDEAARVKDLLSAWNSVIRPCLADYKGDGFMLSTPKGRNGFWQMWGWGKDETKTEWQSWQMPTYVNPFIAHTEIEAMRASMPERIFAQEIMAEFIDDSGGVFRNIYSVAVAEAQDKPIDGHQYVMGVDWGKHNDFTVLTIVDTTANTMVAMDRFNQIDYIFQVGRLKTLFDRFQPMTIIAESNSMGEPIIEQLQRDNLPVRPFQTTNASKAKAIEDLSLAFEQGFTVINDPVLVGELLAYEAERLPSGLLRYGAPSGAHDDCVMSLAIAYSGIGQQVQILNLNEFLRNRNG